MEPDISGQMAHKFRLNINLLHFFVVYTAHFLEILPRASFERLAQRPKAWIDQHLTLTLAYLR